MYGHDGVGPASSLYIGTTVPMMDFFGGRLPVTHAVQMKSTKVQNPRCITLPRTSKLFYLHAYTVEPR